MKIMVVDDERRIREGIAGFLRHKALADQVVSADSAVQALSRLDDEQPDLLLSDVVMPGMNGIDFVEEALRRRPGMKAVMISGHADVAYLKSAFKLQTVDYILKPVDLHELESVISRACAAIIREQGERRRYEELQHQLEQGRPLLQEQLLGEFLAGRITAEAFTGRAAEFGMQVPTAVRYQAVLVETFGTALNAWTSDWHLLMMTVREVLCEQLILSTGLLSRVQENGAVSLLLCLQEGQDAVPLLAGAVEHAQRELRLEMLAGAGSTVGGLDGVACSFEQAGRALRQGRLIGGTTVMLYDDICCETAVRLPPPDVFDAKVADAFYEEDPHVLEDTLSVCFAPFHVAGLTADSLRGLQLDLLAELIRLLKTTALAEEPDFAQKQMLSALLDCETLPQTERFFRERLLQMQEAFGRRRKKRTLRTIDQVRRLVDEQYADGINVQDIARMVHISPNYLSAVFRAETGEKLTDYITRVRIEHAAQLLRADTARVGEVALQVGYEDQNYFAKLFKKQMGVNPTEYREGNRVEQGGGSE